MLPFPSLPTQEHVYFCESVLTIRRPRSFRTLLHYPPAPNPGACLERVVSVSDFSSMTWSIHHRFRVNILDLSHWARLDIRRGHDYVIGDDGIGVGLGGVSCAMVAFNGAAVRQCPASYYSLRQHSLNNFNELYDDVSDHYIPHANTFNQAMLSVAKLLANSAQISQRSFPSS